MLSYSIAVFIIFISAAIFGYLFGSVLTSELVKKIYKVNPRDYSSHNPGFTNSVRVFGAFGGALVLIGDIAKIILAALVVYAIAHALLPTQQVLTTTPWKNTCWIIYLTGVFATLGHIFPIFFKFKGGKGVAVYFGTLIIISPWITLVAMLVFVMLALITKYYSVASLISCLLAVLLIFIPWMDFFYLIGEWMLNHGNGVWSANYSDHKFVIIGTGLTLFFMWIIICWRHYQNIKRVLNHTENKFSFHRQKF